MNKLKNFKDETGAVAVLFAFMLVGLLGLCALVVDLGSAYVYRRKVQQACDAAALGAAIALPDEVRVESLAQYYVDENGLDGHNAVVEIKDGKVKVSYKGTLNNKFATIWGNKTTTVSCEAVASKDQAVEASGEFDYAIFSGSPDLPLNMANGDYYVEGKVHANNKLNVTTHTKATQYSSVKGGNLDVWNTEVLYKDGDVYKSRRSAADPVLCDHIDMPMYLGDNMWALVDGKIPSLPAESYWTKTISGDLGSWSQSGKDFKNYMAAGEKIMLTNITGSWFDYPLNIKAPLYIKGKGSLRLQPSTVSVANGDIYIYNKPGANTDLYFPWGNSVINGNVYCMSGDLVLGNVTINGNVYCAGQLRTDGGKTTINAPDFVYANSIKTANDTEINGAVIAEYDIELYGGQNTANIDSVLTVYSKHGNIKFGTANSDVHGIIFAPEGSIDCVANVTVYGSIIANEVKLTTARVTVKPPVRKLPFDTTDPNPKPKPSKKTKLIKFW
ncbi:MAG: hypothetical protein IKN54_01485 [Lachnospiraceae bacterium]|nr:hypothetical protein [Lachnospiraceae bacterium]